MHDAADLSLSAGDGDSRALLVVDGDPEARRTLADQIAIHENYWVDEAATGTAALETAARCGYDGLIVEAMLPDMDGRELCRLLRRRGVTCPLLFLSATASDADVILGLDAGADDYIVKPCRVGVLLARLRTQFRRFERSDDAVLPIGPYLFHPRRKVLLEVQGNAKIFLTEKEAAVLKHLYRNRGKVVDRASIVRDVWGLRPDLDTHTPETHIYRLRRKIEPDLDKFQIILSGPHGGYTLGAVEICRSVSEGAYRANGELPNGDQLPASARS